LILSPGIFCGVSLGEQLQQLEAQKQQKEKELARLKGMEKMIENDIATTKALMAQSVVNTVPKIGYMKANAQGFVTPSTGIVHSPTQNWTLDTVRLRKTYEQSKLYTTDEINTIITYHKAYVQNQGFTAGCSEFLAKMAEGTAQLRSIQKYISRKQDEIDELDNLIQGINRPPANVPGTGGDGGADGGGSGSY